MQTFDQSLMSLFRQGLITYEEALRQSSNPDDFALRVSGISATSDSSWDGFEKVDEHAASPQPGQQKPLPQRPTPPSSTPRPSSLTSTPPSPSVIASNPALTRLTPPGSKPVPTSPPPAPAPAGDDDFQIERF